MVLKEFLNKEIATIIVLFFPIYTFWNYFSIGILVYFSMKFYIKKMTYKRAFVLWGSVIWCMLYRLDLGYSFMMAALCTIVMYIIKFKKINMLKQVVISLVGSLMCCLMLWFIICIFKNINPLYRLKEFILISLSNQNWAYGTIGNEDTSVFFWSYMFIPFIMLSCMVYLILHFNILKYENRKIWILLLILGFSYFFNFSRGLVRHSLAENKTKLIIWSAYVFLAMFFSYIIKKKIYFLPIYMFLLVLNTLFFTPLSFNENSILENLNLKIEQIKSDWNNKKYDNKTYWEKIANERKVINRVELDEHLKATVLKYKQIIDILLKKKETFVDFINKTDAWDTIFSSLAPNGFRLSLDTHLTVENGDSTIENTKRTLHLSGEVDVTWGIDNVNLVAFPVGSDSCGSNSNTAFLFLFHPVSSCTTSITLNEVDFVFQTCTVKNCLGGRGLTCVNMGNNTDIAKLC